MKRIGDDLDEILKNLEAKAARLRETTSQNEKQRYELVENGKVLTIQNSISEDCPNGTCDGSGYILVYDAAEHKHQDADREKRKAEGSRFPIYPPYEYLKECKCLPQLKQRHRARIAGIPEEFRDLSLNSFNTNIYDLEESRAKATRAKQAAANFVKNFDRIKTEYNGKGLYFWSRTKGSGKTRIGASIANAIIKVHADRGETIDVRYAVLVDLIEQIKETFDNDSKIKTKDVTGAVMNADVLILDDLGVESESPFVNKTLYRLLNHRMTKELPTIFTSNIPVEELDLRFKQDDGRIRSRIMKMAFSIAMPEESARTKIALAENEDLSNLLFE